MFFKKKAKVPEQSTPVKPANNDEATYVDIMKTLAANGLKVVLDNALQIIIFDDRDSQRFSLKFVAESVDYNDPKYLCSRIVTPPIKPAHFLFEPFYCPITEKDILFLEKFVKAGEELSQKYNIRHSWLMPSVFHYLSIFSKKISIESKFNEVQK